MKMGRLKALMMRMTVYLELVLAFFITAAVIIGMFDLWKYVIMIFTTNAIDTYDVLQKFLGHVLMMVVGVELIAMLVMHTPGSVIEVLLYAVARNMLIGSKETFDFILGVAAIAGIFAIRKYLFTGSIAEDAGSSVFTAAASIEEVNNIAEVHIPESIASTIGGVVSHIATQACRQIYDGAVFNVADAEIKVLKVKEGVIERVSVMENSDK
jgi:hypothetical protein